MCVFRSDDSPSLHPEHQVVLGRLSDEGVRLGQQVSRSAERGDGVSVAGDECCKGVSVAEAECCRG